MSSLIALRNLFMRVGFKIIRPIIFLMEPEQAHSSLKRVGVFLGNNFFLRKFTGLLFNYDHPSLNTTVNGINYRNPIGLSAGFDKDGELTKIYPHLGFGLAELGSFTGEICPGNPGKRLFRMKKSKSIVVWYGLNNEGSEKISQRLSGEEFGNLRVGINAALTNLTPEFILEDAIADYLKTMKLFKDIGDYYDVNISCPNTQEGEPFVDKQNLDALLIAINKEIRPISDKPIYVKLAADMTIDEINIIVDACVEHKMDGVVCTNLAKPQYNTEHRPEEYPTVDGRLPEGKGAMSGLPLQRISTNVIRHVYRRTRGKLTIIGVGGIFNAKDAYEKITSGASLCHMITAMIFDGPQSMSEINRGLVKLLKADGFKSISEAVGSRNPLPKESKAKLQNRRAA